jgi:hypothetical protein
MKSAELPPHALPPAQAAKIDSLEIRWPDGTRETRRDIAPGAAVVFEQKAAGSRR